MIAATAFDDMSVEELVRFAQQRLALLVSVNPNAEETGVDREEIAAAMQEVAREAKRALDVLDDAPAAILNWRKDGAR